VTPARSPGGHGLFEPFPARPETYRPPPASFLVSTPLTQGGFSLVFRSLILFAVLGLSVAGAKTFEITLDSAAKAGSVELKPGKYNLVLMEDSKIRFTSANGQAVETSAKLSTVEKKFPATLIDLKQMNGTAQINEIDLGGTKTRIQFE
jgi:hypothetical protein